MSERDTATDDQQRAVQNDHDDADPRRWGILGVLCLSLVLTVANNSGLNVALPTLSRELDASQTQLQWMIDIYVLIAGVVMFAGALADRYGRRLALLGGLSVFAIAATAASFADTANQVLAARAGMGLGAAFIVPATLSILTNVFPPAERGRAIAIWAGFAGAGSAIGPVGAGLLLEHFWWGSVFLINLPIIAAAVIGGIVLIPSSRDPHGRPLDLIGAGLSILVLGGLLFGIIQGPDLGWTHPLVLTSFTISVAAGGAFVWWERRVDEPMVDLDWFRNRNLATGTASVTLAFFAAIALFFTLQFVLGYSALEAGLAQLPAAAAMIVVSNIADWLVERYGPRVVISTGLGSAAAAVGYLAAVAGTDTGYLLLVPGLVAAGTGLALSTAPSTGLIMGSTPTDRAAVGSAINDTTRDVGGALGVAVIGSILTSIYRAGVPTDQLAAEQVEAARSSIGAALQIARDDADLETFSVSVRDSFTNGFRISLAAAAVIVAVAAIVVNRLGPRTQQPDSNSDEVDSTSEHDGTDATAKSNMNSDHDALCSSEEWADHIRDEVLPRTIGDHDLGGHVLEIGPGFGAATRWLVSMVTHLTVIEPDDQLADELESEFPTITVVRGSAADTPFDDHTFTATVCFTMLHHVESSHDQDAIFAEVARTLRTNGLFIGSDSLRSDGLAAFHHNDTCNPIDPASLPDRLTDAGFTEINVDVHLDDTSMFTFTARPRPPEQHRSLLDTQQRST